MFLLWEWSKIVNDPLEIVKYVVKFGQTEYLDITIFKCCHRYVKKDNIPMSR